LIECQLSEGKIEGMKLSTPPSVLALACSVLWTVPASARLGESEEECSKRYGQPVAEIPALLETATSATYQKGDVRVRIEFLEGKAAFISFSRRGLKEEERQTLLDINAGTLVWSPAADYAGRTYWVAPANTKDAARHASSYLMGETGYIDLATEAWTKAMKAQQAVQFAVQPKPATPATPGTPGAPAATAPPAGGKLEGF